MQLIFLGCPGSGKTLLRRRILEELKENERTQEATTNPKPKSKPFTLYTTPTMGLERTEILLGSLTSTKDSQIATLGKKPSKKSTNKQAKTSLILKEIGGSFRSQWEPNLKESQICVFTISLVDFAHISMVAQEIHAVSKLAFDIVTEIEKSSNSTPKFLDLYFVFTHCSSPFALSESELKSLLHPFYSNNKTNNNHISAAQNTIESIAINVDKTQPIGNPVNSSVLLPPPILHKNLSITMLHADAKSGEGVDDLISKLRCSVQKG